MPGCVLVPLDGSPLANRALAYASILARAGSYPVLLLRVLTPQPPRGEELVQEPEARAELERIAARLSPAGLSVSCQISTTLFGSPAEVIVDTALREGAQIIVMSTHGRSGLGRWVYGSVAESVLRLAKVPVLLVPAISRRTWPARRAPRILLALDGSDLAAGAVEPTSQWAQALGAEVVVVRVLPRPTAEAAAYLYEDRSAEHTEAAQTLQRTAARLREVGIRVTLRTPIGEPAECIAAIVREQDIDLISMATHGYSGISKVVLGSVATETLQRAAVPMLLARVLTPVIAPTPDHSKTADTSEVRPMRLLVPLDLTDKANAVLPEVSRIAAACDAEVVLLNVFSPIGELGGVGTDSRAEGITYLKAERRMYLERKAKQLPGVNVSIRIEDLRHGEEVDEGIVRVATEMKATMLLLATSHLATTTEMVLGSVARGVLARTTCPVTIVRYERRPASAAVADHASQTAGGS